MTYVTVLMFSDNGDERIEYMRYIHTLSHKIRIIKVFTDMMIKIR